MSSRPTELKQIGRSPEGRAGNTHTTIRYDRVRQSFDRNASYMIAQYLAGAT